MALERLRLKIVLQDEKITMDFDDRETVAPRGQLEIRTALLLRINADLARITHDAILGTRDAAQQHLQALGEQLFAQAFPPRARERLRQSEPTDLLLDLDDHSVQVPWELAFDGEDFLCRKFHIGRTIHTLLEHAHQKPEHQPSPARSLRMLIIAADTAHLVAPAQEATQLYALLAPCRDLKVEVIAGGEVEYLTVLKALSQYDLVHYAGHAHFDTAHPGDSGWILPDGHVLTATELGRVPHPPLLVFSNACQSGETTAWQAGQALGIGSAFLLAGTQNYIGTFCVIPDLYSAQFALDFYQQLVTGARIGHALSVARQQAFRHRPQSGLLWASYMHYGDPVWHLPVAPMTLPTPAVMPKVSRPSRHQFPRQHPPETVDPHANPAAHASAVEPSLPPSGSRLHQAWHTLWHHSYEQMIYVLARHAVRLGMGASICLLILGVGYWTLRVPVENVLLSQAHQLLAKGNIPRAVTVFRLLDAWGTRGAQAQAEAGLTTVALMRGDVLQAHDLARQEGNFATDSGNPSVLRGLTLLHQGRVAEAMTAFQTVAVHPHTAPCPRAIASTYLGRLHATQAETHPQALDEYDKAMEQCPPLAAVYTDKGALLAQLGRYDEARLLYTRARQLRPEDPLTTVLVEELERRQRLEQDAAHRQRIKDQLQELEEAARRPRPAAPAGDTWTSRPLSLVFEPFQQRYAPGARGGAATGLEKRLWDAFQRGGRTVVVERERLEILLSEQRLCVAGLCDAALAPQLGKLVGARLIVLGELSLLTAGEGLSVRVLDTTTGVIQAAASAQQPLAQPDRVVQLAQELLRQLRKQYPLQGRISQMAPNDLVILNIGEKQGVTPGLLLEVFDTEAPRNAEGNVLAVYRTPVGQLQVVSVTGDAAATQKVTPMTLEPGWQVKEKMDQ